MFSVNITKKYRKVTFKCMGGGGGGEVNQKILKNSYRKNTFKSRALVVVVVVVVRCQRISPHFSSEGRRQGSGAVFLGVI